MGRLLSFWSFIKRHKYAVAVVLFLLFISVVDDNNLWSRYQRRVEISNLRREIEKFQSQYDDETAQLEALDHDPQAAERMARERYFMKRPNEDIFVFVQPDSLPNE